MQSLWSVKLTKKVTISYHSCSIQGEISFLSNHQCTYHCTVLTSCLKTDMFWISPWWAYLGKSFANEKLPFPQMTMGAISEKKIDLAIFDWATAKNIIMDIHFLEYFDDGHTREKSFTNEKIPFPQMTMGAFSEWVNGVSKFKTGLRPCQILASQCHFLHDVPNSSIIKQKITGHPWQKHPFIWQRINGPKDKFYHEKNGIERPKFGMV